METIGQEVIEEEIQQTEIKAVSEWTIVKFNLPPTEEIVSDVLVRVRCDVVDDPILMYRWVLNDAANGTQIFIPTGTIYYAKGGGTTSFPRSSLSGNVTLEGMQTAWDRYGMVSYYLTVSYKVKRTLTLWDRMQIWWKGLLGGLPK